MIESVFDIILDTVTPNRNRIYYGVQTDSGARFLNVTVATAGRPIHIDEGTPYINVRRADGEKNSFEGTLNEDGTVRVPIEQWALEVPGEVTASVMVVNGERKLSTTEFYIMAQEDVNPEVAGKTAEGGVFVVANPEEEATEILTKIKIFGKTYSLPFAEEYGGEVDVE